MSDIFSVAWKYHTLGRCVIPSGGGDNGKRARIEWKIYQATRPTDAQLEKWRDEINPTIWAMPTGLVSGAFVVDCDNAEANVLMRAAGLKPHVRTPRGFHYYVKWPTWVVSNSSRLLPGVDIRGQGGYVNFCGKNGKASYEVLIMPLDDNLYTIEQLPTQLQKALNPKPRSLAERLLQEALDKAQPGNRNETGFCLACQLRDKGLSRGDAEAFMREYAAGATKAGDPYPEEEALSSLDQAFTRPPREPWRATGSFNLTDLGNAERLVKHYGDILRYSYDRKQWLVWNGHVWEWDTGAQIVTLATLAVRNIYHEAGNEDDEGSRKKIAVHARVSESEHRIKSMIALAQAQPGIPIKATELDADTCLFNCQNGTVDLRTGNLQPHRKEDMLTVIVPIRYDPDAKCPQWGEFLARVTDMDKELQNYLQRAVGYSLTGETREQCLFFLYGLGSNGKTTFLNLVRKMMGDYGDKLNSEALMAKEKALGGPKESLANLKGKRFVIGGEVGAGRRLNVSLVKDLTGSDYIKADRKYEHEIEFAPTHKLWIMGNYKPVITDTSLAMWRRMKLIPFVITIPPDEIDKKLPVDLEGELPGILAWAVQGCLAWQRGQVEEPKGVVDATSNYRREQDMLHDFLDDCCVMRPDTMVGKTELWQSYKRWSEAMGQTPIMQHTFRERLIERGIKETKVHKGRQWVGIGLVIEPKKEERRDAVTDVTANSVNFLRISSCREFMENAVTSVTPAIKRDTSPVPTVPKDASDDVPPDIKRDISPSLVPVVPNDAPDYPTEPCSACGCDGFWLTDWGEWLCWRCHPKSEDDQITESGGVQ